MEEKKRNNALDNLEENKNRLYEILGVVGDIKSKINGSTQLYKRVKEGIEPEQNTINGKISKQTGILEDIFEEVKMLYELV